MDKQSKAHWSDLMLAAGVTVAVPVLVLVVWPLVSPWFASAPRGPILTYAFPGMEFIDLDQAVQVVQRRLNSEGRPLAVVKPCGDHIEVTLYRNTPTDFQQVEQLLDATTTLRIQTLATTWRNADIIAQAMANPSKAAVVNAKGYEVARWVPVKPGGEKFLATYDDIAKRTKSLNGRNVTEVLVMEDDYGLNGLHLKEAEVISDQLARLLLELRLTSQGGQIFRRLTSSHLPDKKGAQVSKLAIVLNGELCAAPVIVSTLQDRAQIPCAYNQRTVEGMVNALNAGALPAKMQLLHKKTPSP